ncbi:MAG: transglycosylase SLT domain-containing protein [Bacteroidaceae bacterium]
MMRNFVDGIVCVFLLFLLMACGGDKQTVDVKESVRNSVLDLPDIEEGGELICVTISGPDTYFEYHGRGVGLQYFMAEDFANSLGLRLRMEIARDTAEMISLIKNSKADVVACELPRNVVEKAGLSSCEVKSEAGVWAVNKEAVLLREAVNEWYCDTVRLKAINEMKNYRSQKQISRNRVLKYDMIQNGSGADYDALFVRAAKMLGWDWKLIAAQCFQESAFNHKAVSWAGARGLMQIMPSTAEALGVNPDDLFNPEINVMTSAKYMSGLNKRFEGVRNPIERIKFVLAAYNGGYGHVSDAMNLARKYGKNPYLWENVGFFVQHLSEAKYYRDPIVKYGYMVGNETYDYVNNIMMRWSGDGNASRRMPVNKKDNLIHSERRSGIKNNRFSKPKQIIGREDSLFSIKR